MANTSSHKLPARQVESLLALGLSSDARGDSGGELETALELAAQGDNSQVRLILADLQTPLLGTGAGPWSFQRLLGLSPEESRRFDGQSVMGLLVSPNLDLNALQVLQDYGELLSSEVFPLSTRLTGSVIRKLVAAQVHQRTGRPTAQFDSLVNSLAGAVRGSAKPEDPTS